MDFVQTSKARITRYSIALCVAVVFVSLTASNVAAKSAVPEVSGTPTVRLQMPYVVGSIFDTCQIPIIQQECAASTKITNLVTNPLNALDNGIITDMLTGIDTWVENAAVWVLDKVVSAISADTTPSNLTTAGWFTGDYSYMVTLAALIMLLMLLLSCMLGAIKGDASLPLRAGFVYVPIACIGTFLALYVVDDLVQITNWMSSVVLTNMNTNYSDFVTNVASALSGTGAANLATPFVALIASFFIVIFGFFIFLELLIREAAIYATAIFIPLILSVIVFPAASRMATKFLETMVFIIFSKFVLITVLAIGIGAIGSGTGFAAVLAGVVIIMMTAFTPMAVLALVPTIDGSISAFVTSQGIGVGQGLLAAGTAANVYSGVRRSSEARMAASSAVQGTTGTTTGNTGSSSIATVGLMGSSSRGSPGGGIQRTGATNTSAVSSSGNQGGTGTPQPSTVIQQTQMNPSESRSSSFASALEPPERTNGGGFPI